ncbi:phage tail sheath C-terminal domain-containing protein [Pelagibius sp.]|uniref:phage tail sheath family protein n=1 Tax=Pelagibius sp. TaxID=1931238 RepID=UPI00261645CB|nr:phage tail sheath C-terminal domain-containing protein [Pelagibius sp.]
MPVNPTYPGVYIQELPSGVRTITGVATSIAAFVGWTARVAGRDNFPYTVRSFGEYERIFGGLHRDSHVSYAVQQFFANGGTEAHVVRVPRTGAVPAAITLEDGTGGAANAALTVTAAATGLDAHNRLIDVDYDAIPASDTAAFNLTITDLDTGAVERFPNVSMSATSTRNVVAVVNDEATGSKLVTVAIPDATAGRPIQTGAVGADVTLGSLLNDNNYTIRISSDVPAGQIANVDVTIFETGETLPQSVLGLARHVERKINQAISNLVPGAAVRCVPSNTGAGIRVIPDFSPELLNASLDARLTFAAGVPNSALAMIGLNTGTRNVGHYRLGLGRDLQAQTGAVPATAGTGLPNSQGIIGNEGNFTGLYALKKVDLFNILCIPDATRSAAGDPNTLDSTVDPNEIFARAMELCVAERAFLLVDPPPEVRDTASAIDWISGGLTVSGVNGAAYYPHLLFVDPLDDFQVRKFPPCGAMAGLYARTDTNRGVWKSPAGTEATLSRVRGLTHEMTDAENGALNPLGLNCIRNFPVFRTIAWGARTLDGADARASEWKYLSPRRLALFMEESLYRGTKWAVFEPNGEQLWSQLRLNVSTFMHQLFRQGAFKGTTPQEAYFVTCDATTTTQADIDRGIVNVLVGFAPLKPAEFVIITLQQLAGQDQV